MDLEGEEPPADRQSRYRTVRQRTLIRALQRGGFYLARSKGRHLIFKHPRSEEHVAIPRHARDLANGTFKAILVGAERILGEPVVI